ncbi:endoglucanase [Bacteroidia bacterium]|nr:endoglucanase [Bacteroidia bacterium]
MYHKQFYNTYSTTLALAIVFLAGLISCTHKELIESDSIRFNQLGFYPSEEKVAVVFSDSIGKEPFSIRNLETNKIVFKGKLSEPRTSSFSDKKTTVLTFTDVTTPGKYQIEIPAIGKSHPFAIKDNLLKDIALAGLKGFYYQRASTPIEEKYAGKWNRPAGHPDDKVLIHASAVSPGRPENKIISSPKGWYDAGDYNKYVVNSGFTVGVLLALYEDFAIYTYRQNANIPESGNGTPDLLNETYWNIDWMLSMQDPYDGGVYHKLTEPQFESFIKPIDCKKPRYVITKTVTAALDFAASLAQASRIYSDYETDYPGASEKMLAASRRAFDWALKNPTALYSQEQMNEKFDPDVTTGAYGDRTADDEFFWAAVELYISTQDEKYLKVAEQYAPDKYVLPTWSRVSGLGEWTLIRYAASLDEKSEALGAKAKQLLLAYADSASQKVETSPYLAPYGRDAKDFFWGCNSDGASNQGATFIYAWMITGNKSYLTNALRNMDYVLGRNATGFCYVTGQGYKSTMNPHHRLSASDELEDPIPGLLAGGPNPGKQDRCTYPTDIPDECYLDEQASYATNEIAINWQSLFVYLSTALDAVLSNE